MKFLKDDLKDSLIYFGYSNDPESDEKNTETSFFKYDRESFTED